VHIEEYEDEISRLKQRESEMETKMQEVIRNASEMMRQNDRLT